MNRIFNEILYLVTRAQGSEMPWWIVGVGWHWCLSFNIAKLLKFGACLIFRVVKCVLLCTPPILLCSFWKALRVCSVSWQDWDAGLSSIPRASRGPSGKLEGGCCVFCQHILSSLSHSLRRMQADGSCHKLCGKNRVCEDRSLQVLGTSWAVHSLSKVLRDLRESLR